MSGKAMRLMLGLGLLVLVLALAGCTTPTPAPVPTQQAPAATKAAPGPAPTQPAPAPAPTQGEPAPTQPAPGPAVPTPNSANDWERIQAAGKMTAGTSADYAPFSYRTPDFKIDGFDPAVIREMARRLGIQVEVKDFAFDGLGGALVLGQVDSAIAAISVTPKRAELVSFTHPYYAGEDAILGNPSYSGITIRVPENMAGLKVGVQKGSVYETWLQDTLVESGLTPPENLLPYADIRQAMNDLVAKDLDIVMLDFAPAQAYVNSGEAKLVGRGLNKQSYAIATRLGSSLEAQLDKVLDEMQADGTVQKLAEQYGLIPSENKPAEPTAVPVPPTPTGVPVPPTATPVPPCVDGMAWVADLNLDDHGMTTPPVMQPGQGFTKSWRVRNSGTCPWQPTFVLNYVTGNTPAARMNGMPVMVGREVPVNGTIDLSVNLIAPTAPGVYQGIWQMHNDAGIAFGERIWVGIQVPGAAPPPPPTAAPQPPAPPTAGPPPPPPVGAPLIVNFAVNPSQIQQGQCVGIDWDVQGSISWVRILVNNAVRWDGQPTRGHINDCPGGSGTVTYSLESGGPGGTSRQDRTVQINQQPPPQPAPNIDYFTGSTDRVRPGQCVDLSWGLSGGKADYVRLSRNGQEIMNNPGATRFTDCPTTLGVANYTLTAGNSSGQKNSSLAVQVVQ